MGNYLKQSRRGTVFYFRRCVPDDLRLLIGKPYLVSRSAQESDYKQSFAPVSYGLDFSMLWHRMAISDISVEPAMSLNVSLPPELENRVRQHVESGLYSSASEVIREALRLFEAYQGVQAANLAALKADIAQGVADINAGRVREVSMSSIKERGRAILASPKAI